jgi:hypothetical protein
MDAMGSTMDKSSNPFLEGFVRIDNSRKRLLEIRAKMQALSDKALLAEFEAEEREERAAAMARKSKTFRR